MLKIGITGNIGSGKTTVSEVFELLGVPVFYADDEAKKVMVADELLKQDIQSAFGNQSYFDDGTLNRKHLSNIVFNNAGELAKLNAIVHPAVFRSFDSWAKLFTGRPYVLKEAALLFESDSYKMCDLSILVTAPLDLRIKRVIQRDHIPAEEVEKRNARQFPQEQKMSLANYIIQNDEKELVIPQVLALHQQFLTLSRAK